MASADLGPPEIGIKIARIWARPAGVARSALVVPLWRLLCRRRKRRQFVDVARVVLDDQRGLESRHDPLQPLD